MPVVNYSGYGLPEPQVRAIAAIVEQFTIGGALSLVNDLVTGGTNAALTAQQGSVLKGLIDSKVSPTQLATVNGQSLTAGGNIVISTSGGGGTVQPTPTDWNNALPFDLLSGRKTPQTDRHIVANGEVWTVAQGAIDGGLLIADVTFSALPTLPNGTVVTVTNGETALVAGYQYRLFLTWHSSGISILAIKGQAIAPSYTRADNFNRADSVLTGQTPSDGLSAWQKTTPQQPDLVIRSGTLQSRQYILGTGALDGLGKNYGMLNCRVVLPPPAGDSQWCGLSAVYTDTSDWKRLVGRWFNDRWAITRIIGNTETDLITSTVARPVADDTVTMDISALNTNDTGAKNVVLKRNGVAVLSYRDEYGTTNRFGAEIFGGGGETQCAVDEFVFAGV